MFKDFDKTKAQLSELADVVNKFKSEAVQLRLLELLFDSKPHSTEPEQKDAPAQPANPKRKKTRTKKKASGSVGSTGAKRFAGLGGPAIVSRLLEEGFFSQARTIGDICAHADQALARRIKPNEISGKLSRMVRNGDLSRVKNSENQYEYTKP